MIHTLKRQNDHLILNFVKKYFKIINHNILSKKLARRIFEESLDKKQQFNMRKKLKKISFSKNMQNICKIIRSVNESVTKNGIQRNT